MTAFKLLNIREVVEMTGISRSTILRNVELGLFPKPLKLAPKTVRWDLATLTAWVNDHASK